MKRHAQALKLKADVTVVSLNIVEGTQLFKKQIDVFEDEAGLETHHIYLETRFRKLLYVLLPIHYFILKKYVLALHQQKKFATLHANIIFPCGIVAYWLSKKMALRFIITEHWTKIDKFFSSSLYASFGKKTYDRAHAVTSVSEQLAGTLRKHTSNKNIVIVPNVIDSHEFYYDANSVKNAQFTFVAVAHWAQHKNPFYFLEALKILVDRGALSNFKVVMIGEGEQIQKIKDKSYNFKIEFKGSLSSPDVSRELNKSHVFLHGSDFETFSVIIAEALMCGLPSVVSPVGIGPEVINASNGFVTDNTVNDWAEKILAVYQKSYNYQEIADQLKGRYDAIRVGALLAKSHG